MNRCYPVIKAIIQSGVFKQQNRSHTYPITDVFSKYGFEESGVGSNYAHDVARVLRKHGYAVRVVDAVAHCEYIKKVATPKPNRRVLSGEEARFDPEIIKILDKEFPFDIKLIWDGTDCIEVPKKS